MRSDAWVMNTIATSAAGQGRPGDPREQMVVGGYRGIWNKAARQWTLAHSGGARQPFVHQRPGGCVVATARQEPRDQHHHRPPVANTSLDAIAAYQVGEQGQTTLANQRGRRTQASDGHVKAYFGNGAKGPGASAAKTIMGGAARR